MPVDPELMAALEDAIERSPDNVSVRLHLVQVVAGAGDHDRALSEVAEILARDPVNLPALRVGQASARAIGDETRAAGYAQLVEALSQRGSPTSGSSVHGDDDRAFEQIVAEDFGGETPGPATPEFVPGEWEIERPKITLADVAGMAEVKRRLDLSFLAPLRNPELREAYAISLRGGLLLYGPPGCGKTFIARATAGELGSRFLAVGLSDVLDMWFGESERRLHEIFEQARRNAPCVLFLDEIDALGHKRSQLRSSPSLRTVVNQLLAELDGVAESNEGVFVLAATNHPWDVDTALRRPGRFDRVMLVLPPDRTARGAILRFHLQDRPASGVDLQWVAKQTEEYSGADLANLCATSAQVAMEESISRGAIGPMTTDHFRRALKDVQPSTRPWFEVAKNYAMFANEGGEYDDLLSYVRFHRI